MPRLLSVTPTLTPPRALYSPHEDRPRRPGPDQHDRWRHRGEPRRDPDALGRSARSRRATSSPSPSWRSPATRPKTSCLRLSFCEASREAVRVPRAHTAGLIAVVGFVDWYDGDAHNAAAVFVDGEWVDTYHKHRLPNYGVFDEERYFRPGKRTPVYRGGLHASASASARTSGIPALPLDAMALGGAELVHQHQRLAVPPRASSRPRAHARDARRRQPDRGRLRELGRRPGRARLRRRIARLRRRRAADRPRRRSSRKSCWSSTSTSTRARSAACTTRAAASSFVTANRKSTSTTSASTSRPAPARQPPIASRTPSQPLLERRGRGLARARPRRRATTSARPASSESLIGLSGGIDSTPRRRDRRRRPRAASTSSASRCRPATRATQHATTPTRSPQNLGIRYLTHPHRAGARRRCSTCSPTPFEGTAAARPRRTSSRASAATCSWRSRTSSALDRAHHRQQERDGHRLRDALRRHGRRLRGDQGRAEDAGLPRLPRSATSIAGRRRHPASR